VTLIRQRAFLIAVLSFACNVSLKDEGAVVGTYVSNTVPPLSIQMLPDHTFTEEIEGRRVIGRWQIWVNMGTRDRHIEITGLIHESAERQTNSRVNGRLRKTLWRTILRVDGQRPMDLERVKSN